jgi:hypothetical protein
MRKKRGSRPEKMGEGLEEGEDAGEDGGCKGLDEG